MKFLLAMGILALGISACSTQQSTSQGKSFDPHAHNIWVCCVTIPLTSTTATRTQFAGTVDSYFGEPGDLCSANYAHRFPAGSFFSAFNTMGDGITGSACM